MKEEKKSRVTWASDSMLCQVKMFLAEDIPAKVSSRNPPMPSNLNLPPGFEATEYATRRFISGIPLIKWKRPPKFILDDALLVGTGGESTETRTENLRISKALEAFYPHRSVIPARPSVSLAVVEEYYDDNKTRNIRLSPIEDEHEAVVESSFSSKAPATTVTGLGPHLSLAASAALSALMKTKEQGSLVDTDLLVQLLSDPKIVKNLLNDMKGKPLLETAHNITTPRLAPQHVTTSSAMDRNPAPVPRTPPGNGVPQHNVPVSVQSSATEPPLQALSMNLNLQKHTPLSSWLEPLPRVEDSYATALLKPSPVLDVAVVSEQKTQSLNMSTISTWNVNSVLESARTETDAQIRSGYINRDDQVSAQPVKNLDYFKNLIRVHGGVNQATNETNKNRERATENKVVKVKIQRPCMYFNRPKGCRLGDSCLYLHDDRSNNRSWTDVAPHFPRAKRLKFGT